MWCPLTIYELHLIVLFLKSSSLNSQIGHWGTTQGIISGRHACRKKIQTFAVGEMKEKSNCGS